MRILISQKMYCVWKEEWINGLAKIYKAQGLSDTKLVGSEYHNEIREKLMETTGLEKSTVNQYLHDEFKQESKGGGGHVISAVEKVEKVLGKKGADEYKKQVLAESSSAE